MTNHQPNIVKLVDLIEYLASSKNYLTSEMSLVRLNALVEAHAIIKGVKPEYYQQTEPEPGPAKDYHVG